MCLLVSVLVSVLERVKKAKSFGEKFSTFFVYGWLPKGKKMSALLNQV